METILMEEIIKLEADSDVVAAWKTGLALGRRLGFDRYKQACLSGAILQMSRPAVERGKGGVCTIRDASDPKSLRAIVTIESRGGDFAGAIRERLNAEIALGPWQPPVKLSHAVESCAVEGGRVELAIQQSRTQKNGRPGVVSVN
jgi:hypothetical protein